MRLTALLAMLLAGPVWAEAPRVITDFGPVQALVLEVMGDLGAPVMLVPPGGDPHDFQLRPSQARALATADLVFWVGPDLMPGLGDALASVAPQAQVVALLHASGQTRAFADGGTDPHGWLNPGNGAAWAATIAETLSAKDPANAATYTANARALTDTLTTLDAELATLLAPVKDRPFVVYHDALGYFTDHYGLTVAGAIELGDASTPSAARMADIQRIITTKGAVCVFPEAGRDPKFIAALTEGLPVRIGTAQDIEFITLPVGPGQYAKMLRSIATTLAECLQG